MLSFVTSVMPHNAPRSLISTATAKPTSPFIVTTHGICKEAPQDLAQFNSEMRATFRCRLITMVIEKQTLPYFDRTAATGIC
jgi:hypothetical protein